MPTAARAWSQQVPRGFLAVVDDLQPGDQHHPARELLRRRGRPSSAEAARAPPALATVTASPRPAAPLQHHLRPFDSSQAEHRLAVGGDARPAAPSWGWRLRAPGPVAPAGPAPSWVKRLSSVWPGLPGSNLSPSEEANGCRRSETATAGSVVARCRARRRRLCTRRRREVAAVDQPHFVACSGLPSASARLASPSPVPRPAPGSGSRRSRRRLSVSSVAPAPGPERAGRSPRRCPCRRCCVPRPRPRCRSRSTPSRGLPDRGAAPLTGGRRAVARTRRTPAAPSRSSGCRTRR